MNKLQNSPSLEQAKAIDLAHHWHPFTDQGSLQPEELRVISEGEGCYVWDGEGNKLLDAMAGLWCVNVGYGRSEISQAVQDQMAKLAYYNTFFKTTHTPAALLAERLAKLTPNGLNKIFFTGSGSESNDTVLRLSRAYWNALGKNDKTVIISRKNAYHGSTMTGVSLGGMEAMHSQGGPLIPDIAHINQPYWFREGSDEDPDAYGVRLANELDQKISEYGEDRVAAFIAEPVQGAGGVIVPPDSYWPQIQKICSERSILLIVDEVICGFGRLGEWFGSVHYGLKPDIISMAKGLSSGYLPIGAVAASETVADAIANGPGEFFHGYTYSGHPACCAAALANLDILQSEKIIERAKEDIIPEFSEKWATLSEHALVGEARSRGLMGALELVPNKPQRTRFEDEGEVGVVCRNHAIESGFIMRAVRDTMIVSPPLIITSAQIDELVQKAWIALDLTQASISG